MIRTKNLFIYIPSPSTTTTIRVEESTTAKGESVAEYEGSSEEVTEEVIKQGRAVIPQNTTTDLYSASTTELPTTEQTFDVTAEDSITNSKNSNIHIEDVGNTNVTSSIEDELKKPYGGYGLGGGKIYAKIFPEVRAFQFRLFCRVIITMLTDSCSPSIQFFETLRTLIYLIRNNIILCVFVWQHSTIMFLAYFSMFNLDMYLTKA